MNAQAPRFSFSYRRLIEEFRQELNSNPRFSRMLWLIAYLLAMYVVVAFYDENQQLASQAAQLQAELARSSGTSEKSVWEERLHDERTLGETLRQSCWKAPSDRLASADMQTVLQQLTANYELNNVRLTMSKPEPHKLEAGESWMIRAQVRGNIVRSKVPPLVHALENRSTYFSIEQLRYTSNRTSGGLDMTVAACFLGEAG